MCVIFSLALHSTEAQHTAKNFVYLLLELVLQLIVGIAYLLICGGTLALLSAAHMLDVLDPSSPFTPTSLCPTSPSMETMSSASAGSRT